MYDFLCLFREEATIANSCFYLRAEKDDNKVVLEDKDLEVIGVPASVQYDDTTVFLQHFESGLWLSYKVSRLWSQTTSSNEMILVFLF